MAKNYMQDGNTVRFTATAAVKSGDVVMLENLAAISVSDVVQNETGVGLTTGVFTVKAKADDGHCRCQDQRLVRLMTHSHRRTKLYQM